jgi:hypothetical protein
MNDLRTLLHDAVADVEPELGLPEIQARTSAGPGRRWLPLLAAAAVLAVAAAGGGFWLTQEGATHNPVATHGKPHPKPSGWFAYSSSPTPSTPGGAPPASRVNVAVYYLGHTPGGPRLYREFYGVDSADPVGLTAAARLAVIGNASDPDYTSLWPATTTIRSVRQSVASGLFEVRFAGTPPVTRPAGMTVAQARMSLQQLVYTVQGTAQDTAPLVFFAGNRQLHRVLGIRIATGLERAPAKDALAPVWIITPEQGQVVGRTFEVRGQAATFEANVQWELLAGRKVVQSDHAAAAECCRLSPYSFTVHATPGSYTLVVHGEDASGQGRPVPQDTKQITVR